PLNVVFDRIDILDIFFYRVSVVETQVALAFIVLGDPEVQADRFRMANMQIAIRLRRETGVYCGVLTTGQIFIDDLTDKVSRADFGLTHRGFRKAETTYNGV